MKNKGFTMIELLAAMVILSLLTMISVPTVLSLLNENRQTTIISDSKKLLSNVEYLVNSNNNHIKRPRGNNNCILISLKYLDIGNDFKAGPHGGVYNKDLSYVIVKRKNTEGDYSYLKRFEYYVTLVENVDSKSGESSFYGIQNIRKDQLTKTYRSKVSGLTKDKLKTKADGTIDTSNLYNKLLDGTNMGCDNIVAYVNKEYDE